MHLAWDSEIKIGGASYWVRRDFDLIRRVEQSFGPLNELDGRLRRFEVKASDLANLATMMLGPVPGMTAIRDHIECSGIPAVSAQLAVVVVHMFAGHAKTIAWLKSEHDLRKAEAVEDEAVESAGMADQNPRMPV